MTRSLLLMLCLAGLLAACGGGGEGEGASEQGDELASCLRGKDVKVAQRLTGSLAENPAYGPLAKQAEKDGGGVVTFGFDEQAAATVTFFVMKDAEQAEDAKKKLDDLSPGARVYDNVAMGVLGFGGKTKPDPEQQKAIDPCLDEL